VVDWTLLRYYVRISRFDRAIIAATALAAVAISVEFCVLVGVFLSFLLAVPRAGRMQLTEFIVSADGVIHERLEDEALCGRILIFGLEGEMFFGAAAALEAHLESIEKRVSTETRVLVLRMKRLRSPDAVCLHLLDEHLLGLERRGVHVIMVGVRGDLYGALRRTGIVDRVGSDRIYREQKVRHTSTQQGIRYAYALVDEPCATCPRRDPAVRDRQLRYAV